MPAESYRIRRGLELLERASKLGRAMEVTAEEGRIVAGQAQGLGLSHLSSPRDVGKRNEMLEIMDELTALGWEWDHETGRWFTRTD